MNPEEYIKNRGMYCPQCGSTEITAQLPETPQDIYIHQQVECEDCGLSWVDVYKLVDIDIMG